MSMNTTSDDANAGQVNPNKVLDVYSKFSNTADASSKAVAWYHKKPPVGVPSSMQRLLEDYAGISPADVMDHVIAVREKAWQVHAFPCLGRFLFLELCMEQTSVYGEVLSRLKREEKLLDMGCCFGQEIRRLVADGVPSENLFAVDLEESFWNLGYELFKDRDTLQTRFVRADIFDPESDLKNLQGTMDIIYTGSFFHLFDYRGQLEASRKVVDLLRLQKGNMIIGRQVGKLQREGGARDDSASTGKLRYIHDPDSFREMWAAVGKDAGVSFDVQAVLQGRDEKLMAFHEPDIRMLQFVIRLE